MTGVAGARGEKWIRTGHDLNHQWEGGPMTKGTGNTKRWFQVKTASKCFKRREPSKAQGPSRREPLKALWHRQQGDATVPHFPLNPQTNLFTQRKHACPYVAGSRVGGTWWAGVLLPDSVARNGERARQLGGL